MPSLLAEILEDTLQKNPYASSEEVAAAVVGSITRSLSGILGQVETRNLAIRKRIAGLELRAPRMSGRARVKAEEEVLAYRKLAAEIETLRERLPHGPNSASLGDGSPSEVRSAGVPMIPTGEVADIIAGLPAVLIQTPDLGIQQIEYDGVTQRKNIIELPILERLRRISFKYEGVVENVIKLNPKLSDFFRAVEREARQFAKVKKLPISYKVIMWSDPEQPEWETFVLSIPYQYPDFETNMKLWEDLGNLIYTAVRESVNQLPPREAEELRRIAENFHVEMDLP